MVQSQPRIVAIGDLTVDMTMPVTFPVEPGRSLQMPFFALEPGGAGSFLIAGQRLGGQMFALGAVGNDLFGNHVLDILRSEGVNVSGVSQPPDISTTTVAVLFEPDTGKFTYLWTRSHGAPHPLTDEMHHIIDNAGAVFMQGFTFVEASLRPLVDYTLASNCSVYYDVGPATVELPEDDRDRIRRRAEVIFATEDEFPDITRGKAGQEAYDFLLSAGVKIIVVKRGALGCRVITSAGVNDMPGFKVQARDLIGAGDCFNAAFIYGILTGLSPAEAGRLANAMGGAKVQKLGTGRAVPTRDEVMAVLNQGAG